MVLQYADIDDAVLATQEALIKKGSFVDLQTDITDHVAVRTLWKEKRKVFDGGNDWQFQAQVASNGSYRSVGLFETDSNAITDTLVEGYVQPRHVNACYIYDQREKSFQRGAKAIVDLVQSRYVAMMVDFYDGLEADLWGCPAATDTKSIHGVGYWVTAGASGEEGFYGDDPLGYSAIGRANILSSSYARWRNYAADYAAVTQEDLIRKINKGMLSTQFKSVVDHSQPDLGAGKTGVYTDLTTSLLLKEELQTRNMNLGNDLITPMPLINSTQVTYVPKLDSITLTNGHESTIANPVFVLDWRWFAIGVLAEWENNLSNPYMVPGKSKVRRVDLDATLELICTNLRKQMLFAKVS